MPKPPLSLQLSFGSLTLLESDFGVIICTGKLKVCTPVYAQLESHSGSNLRIWGSVDAEAQNHAVLSIKIRCEGQENNPPPTAAESQGMHTAPCFSGEGRGAAGELCISCMLQDKTLSSCFRLE